MENTTTGIIMNTEKPDTNPRTEQAGPPLPLFGQEDRIPERIGRFRILDVLAKGMALVYKAEQDNPRRIVALKIPRGGKLLSAEVRQRFLREVQLAANLEHAGIVPVLEAGEIDGVPFYTMPFIEGRSMSQHIEMAYVPGHLAWSEREVAEGAHGHALSPTSFTRDARSRGSHMELFLRLCDVVQALHAEGLVHRDLKPDNVIVDRHGSVRLLDFGLAKAVGDGSTLSGDQSLLGTLQFMAPEQTLEGGQKDITPAADVYALGIMLYWLLTGAYPYNSKGEREAVLRTIREAKPRPPSEANPALRPLYDRVVLACLAKKPADRPPTAGDLAARLRAAANTQGDSALPRVGSSSRKARWLMAGVVILLAAAVWAACLFAKRPAHHEPPNDAEGLTIPANPSGPAQPPVVASRIETYSSDEISALLTVPPPVGQPETLPKDLWPIYERAFAKLRDDFSLGRCGAILVWNRPGGNDAEVSWGSEKEPSRETRSLPAGGAAVLYLPSGRPSYVRWSMLGRVNERRINPQIGEVVCLGPL